MSKVTIFPTHIYFGDTYTTYDELFTPIINEVHPGWRIKVNPSNALAFEYVDAEGVGHEMGSVPAPSVQPPSA